MLNLVGLLDLNADPYAVDAGFDEDALVLVASNGEWCQQHLWRGAGLDLRYIVTFGGL